MQAINHMAEVYQVPVIYSTHPRSMKFIRQRNFRFHPLVRNLTPFGFFDYNCLQMNSLVVLSDSGTLSEESAMLGFCGVLIRTSTERPEVLDKARWSSAALRSKCGAGGAAGYRHAARRRAPRHACGLSGHQRERQGGQAHSELYAHRQ